MHSALEKFCRFCVTSVLSSGSSPASGEIALGAIVDSVRTYRRGTPLMGLKSASIDVWTSDSAGNITGSDRPHLEIRSHHDLLP